MKRVAAPYNIVLAGRGGQGVIFLSRVMGQAALLQGLGVRTTETHGMAMRGGSVQCFVRIGDVYGPLFTTGSADLLVALHPAETALALGLLSPDATILVNESREDALGTTEGGRKVHRLDADRISRECHNSRSANLALLGGAVAMVEGFPLEEAGVEGAIRMIGPERAVEKNLETFRAGTLKVEN